MAFKNAWISLFLKKIKSKLFWLLCVILYTHILLNYIFTNAWLLDMNRQWKITPFTVTTPPPPPLRKVDNGFHYTLTLIDNSILSIF